MLTRILDCPQCGNRFEYENEGVAPEQIPCPKCGKISPKYDFRVLTFCPHCRKKLSIPLDLMESADSITCPNCNQSFETHESSYLSEFSDDTTLDGGDPAALNRPQLLKDGAFFDKYKIIRLIGRGGMAEVYLAEHLLLKRQCALKLMTSMGNEPVQIKRFIREARISHQIDHPNIIKVYDVGSDAETGLLFIAMEYIEGRSLADISSEGPLPERELWNVLGKMTDALIELQKFNVVHRDIKPSNIMRRDDGELILMDLGIAKVESCKDAGELTLTMAQAVIGTPGFASPEQSQSAHDVDGRSDLFSLGATLYALAAGKAPFSGTSTLEILLHVLQKEPEPLELIRPDLSHRFVAIVKQLMEKKKENRPVSAETLGKQLFSKKGLREILFGIRTGMTRFFSSRAMRFLIPRKKGKIQWIRLFLSFILLTVLLGIICVSLTEKKRKEIRAFVYNVMGWESESMEAASYLKLDYRTIDYRLKEVEEKIALLEEDMNDDKEQHFLAFYTQQQRALQNQKELLKRISAAKEKQYDRQTGDEIRSLIADRMKMSSGKSSAFFSAAKITPLIPAVLKALQSGNLDPNMEIHFPDRKSQSLLQLACLATKSELKLTPQSPANQLVLELLKQGADVNLLTVSDIFKNVCFFGKENIDFIGRSSPLLDLLSLMQSRNEAVKAEAERQFYNLLLLAPEVNSITWNGKNLLHKAAEMNGGKMAEQLILAGCSGFEERNPKKRTPWQIALQKGSFQVVRVLEKYEMKTKDREKDQFQYDLFKAILRQESDRIPDLIQAGADPYLTNYENLNALQYACTLGSEAVVKALLDCGMKIAAGTTHPLIIAAQKKNLKVFSVLLEHKFNFRTYIFDGNGHFDTIGTHLCRMFRKKPADAIPFFKRLQDFGWKADSRIMQTAIRCKPVDTKLINFLIREGAPVSSAQKAEIERLREKENFTLINEKQNSIRCKLPADQDLKYPLEIKFEGVAVLSDSNLKGNREKIILMNKNYVSPLFVLC